MKCLVLNLDRSPDRLAFMTAQFQRLGMEWERVPGVDGDTVRLPDPALVDQKAFDVRHHALLRRGEVGCYLSHVKALRTFLASGAAMGLILEDDVVLSADVPTLLDRLATHAARWDIVKLFATHPGGVITRRHLGERYRLVSFALRHGSAAAYVVSRKAASSLLAGLLPMTVPFDHEFDRAWKYRLRLRAVMPFPVARCGLPSTITATGPVDADARAVNARLHKPWHQQVGMVLFRGANDIARVVHELGQV